MIQKKLYTELASVVYLDTPKAIHYNCTTETNAELFQSWKTNRKATEMSLTVSQSQNSFASISLVSFN